MISKPQLGFDGVVVKPRASAIVNSFKSGTSSNKSVNEDGRARFHRSGAVLLSGHK